jgi:hypothetical protein
MAREVEFWCTKVQIIIFHSEYKKPAFMPVD